MPGPLDDVLASIGDALDRVRDLQAERAPDCVSILDVLVTADADDLVVEALGSDGETVTPVARVSAAAPRDAARIALTHALTRLVARAIEIGDR
ncbi:hypothetical protein BHAOGJBA_5123 [Methylobacterium hispanicum]|uniref:Uncharacterized protein n=1 Tax=Methylobacterium hispanicum TaxID=270350 RepID=A0AAV4ZVK9_9HYPH|nr:hypothetical protein [Methylobacterium hispanicum]GJD91575.1 hypothetical protein BHAOGJBA_5123 [Methylobacterium hispanicum]